jgi:TolB protein
MHRLMVAVLGIVLLGPTVDRAGAVQSRPAVIGGQPRVSPDGKRVAFTSWRDGNGEVYLVDQDGKNLRRLTHSPSGEQEASWSPEGSGIVFRRAMGDSASIVAMIVDGLRERVMFSGNNRQFPMVSPDGHQLLFGIWKPSGPTIFVSDVDGTREHEVASGMQATWSPDGSQIVFVAPVSDRSLRVFIANADGSNRRQLSQADGLHEYPTWSPDGKRIAYFASTRGTHDAVIRIVNIDGTNDVAITTHTRPYLDETPSWFPDGKRLAIQSDRDGVMRVYIIAVDGTELARLTP